MDSCIKAVALVLGILLPTQLWAQGRIPRAESAAIGGDIGVFLPAADQLESGLALEGFYEYYLTARTSIRTGLGWANPNFDREEEDSLRHFRIALDLVYNWEGGTIHPFVGAGLGIYFLQLKDNGESIGDSDTKAGGTLFGGFEMFTSNTLSVKTELRYHLIGDTGLNPDGASLMIGVKKYF
ncbi:MAG TPA: outer membrane beta-barrel protein [Vicinamibacterales bacterium]|jgi:opacity protein-like surface antigen|nr:outer membrane beta-barrel protein [Vicinamibacterales bacterium]